MKTIDRIRRDNESYRKANPWILQNIQNSQALCGRYPSEQAAREAAGSDYVETRGNVVYYSHMPSL